MPSIPVLDICGKRLLEYVADCLSFFNLGYETITLRAFGGNILKAFRVQQFLTQEFENVFQCGELHSRNVTLQISSPLLQPAEDNNPTQTKFRNNDVLVEIDIHKIGALEEESYSIGDMYSENDTEKLFISYPIYNLLLEEIVYNKGEILVGDNANKQNGILKIFRNSKDTFSLKLFPEARNLNDRLNPAFQRANLLWPKNWLEIVEKISQFDDIIICVDTNILMTGSLSGHIIPSLYLFDPINYVHTPNWMLVLIPKAVMQEIEHQTNDRNNGFLGKMGRYGYRALQDMLELAQSADIHGISVLIFGENTPEMMLSGEMSQLKKSIRSLNNSIIKSEKMPSNSNLSEEGSGQSNFSDNSMKSMGDAPVRDQFKQFLRQINFHRGGVFFVTSDKTSAALATAEGINALYFEPPNFNQIPNEISMLQTRWYAHELGSDRKDCISLRQPIGKLIYELAVEFGEIFVKWEGLTNPVCISCDRFGKSLDPWIYRDLLIKPNELKKLLSDKSGSIRSLKKIRTVWEKLCRYVTRQKFI